MRHVGGQDFYTISEAAAIAGVSPQTLRVWEAKNLLSPGRTNGRQRLYDADAVEQMKAINEAYNVLKDDARRAAYDADYTRLNQRYTEGVKTTSVYRAKSAQNPQRQKEPHASRSQHLRSPAKYVLRFGMHAGRTLASVAETHPYYLRNYVQTQMGDAEERSFIQAFLASAKMRREHPAHADDLSAQGVTSPDAPPPSPVRTGYVIRFGRYAGQTLYQVYCDNDAYLLAYLAARLGDIAERNAIRAFLRMPRSEWEGAAYELRYGIYKGETLHSVLLRHPRYCESYLRTNTGDAAERNTIRAFLNRPLSEWEPEEDAQEWARAYSTNADTNEPSERYG